MTKNQHRKTEYMLGGVWEETKKKKSRRTSKKSAKKSKKSRRKPKWDKFDLPELRIWDGSYLGCWLLSSFKDFEVRRSLA